MPTGSCATPLKQFRRKTQSQRPTRQTARKAKPSDRAMLANQPWSRATRKASTTTLPLALQRPALGFPGAQRPLAEIENELRRKWQRHNIIRCTVGAWACSHTKKTMIMTSKIIITRDPRHHHHQGHATIIIIIWHNSNTS